MNQVEGIGPLSYFFSKMIKRQKQNNLEFKTDRLKIFFSGYRNYGKK